VAAAYGADRNAHRGGIGDPDDRRKAMVRGCGSGTGKWIQAYVCTTTRQPRKVVRRICENSGVLRADALVGTLDSKGIRWID
jgi:hypothetical protein